MQGIASLSQQIESIQETVDLFIRRLMRQSIPVLKSLNLDLNMLDKISSQLHSFEDTLLSYTNTILIKESNGPEETNQEIDGSLSSNDVFFSFSFQDCEKPFKLSKSFIDQYPDSYMSLLLSDHSNDDDQVSDDPLYIDYDDISGKFCLSLLYYEDINVQRLNTATLKSLSNAFHFLHLPPPSEFLTLSGFKDNASIQYIDDSSIQLLFDGQERQIINHYLYESNRMNTFIQSYTQGQCDYNYIKETYILNLQDSHPLLIETYISTGHILISRQTQTSIRYSSFLFLLSCLFSQEQYLELKNNICPDFIDSAVLNNNFQYIFTLIDWFGQNKKWKLLFRASEHNFSSQSFHDYCDNHGETIILVRHRNSNNTLNLFGGHTVVPWNCISREYGNWDNDGQCCLFTLQNTFSIPPTRYPVLDEEDAVCSSFETGPHLGDLCIYDHCDTIYRSFLQNTKCNYIDTPQKSSIFVYTETPQEFLHFFVDEYEVYEVDHQ